MDRTVRTEEVKKTVERLIESGAEPLSREAEFVYADAGERSGQVIEETAFVRPPD